MKRFLFILCAAFLAISAKAELSSEIKELAIECGKTDAAFLDGMHETANSAAATQMFKTSATLFGCTTVSDVREFIRISRAAAS